MIEEILKNVLGNRVKVSTDISPFLTLKTGVKVPYLFVVESLSDWLKVGRLLKEGIRIFVIGGGSNLVVKKPDPQVLFVLNRYAKKKLLKEEEDKVYIKVSSGYPISKLVKETVRKGWGGLEYHWGLPGSVGGAVYMNSKWTKPLSYVGDVVYEAVLLTPKGEVKKVNQEYFKFSYDYSILQETGEIVLEVVFALKKEDGEVLYKRAVEAYNYRRKTQPFGVFSSGCFFKNISLELQEKLSLPTTSAGYLIDKAGLKGFRVGSFEISQKHANFIINKGGGKIEDLEKLIEIVKKRVKEKFKVDLELEVVIF